jgi:two-component system sensor kinase FixL
VLLVLYNLLRNACEATRPQGRVTLQVDVLRAPARFDFVVEDEGAGLAAAVRERLFQPVASTKPGGGGIGLVLSHQLAQHAGGALTLEKSDEGGSRFRLSVPLETTAATSPS